MESIRCQSVHPDYPLQVLASNGGHVHVMESASIDYMVARNCRLRKIGQTFNKKSYGLALPAGDGREDGTI